MTLSAGTSLGPYEIVAQLGSGGMGVVYQAHDPRLDRHVAIKLLPPDLTSDETAKQRFLQEAKAASALDHPNICTIYEINETDDGQLYLVMAAYEGETLKERIERGPLKLTDAVDIATQGCLRRLLLIRRPFVVRVATRTSGIQPRQFQRSRQEYAA